MPTDKNIEGLTWAYNVTHSFSEALHGGDNSLKNVPKLLITIIEQDLWRCRYIPVMAKIVEFDNFADFITTKPLEGLGESVAILRKICEGAGNERALQLLNSVVSEEAKKPGGANNPYGCKGKENQVDNVRLIESKKYGNNQDYLLSRIKRDNPDIFQEYANGKYPSVRQAAIAAEIIKVQTPMDKVVKLLPKLSKAEKERLRKML